MLFLSACAKNNIGYQFVGVKYLNSPLGEDKAPDYDPLIRFDAFDCTTFVETVLADSDVKKLNKIRYKNANVDFLSRNHFIESDWMANNSDIVRNVSAQYAQTSIRTVKIDKKTWFEKVHNIKTDFKPEIIQLEYIPYSKIEKINNKNELVVLFVADNPKMHAKIGTDLAIVHMGFLLPNGMLRHASSAQGYVVDVDFYDYARQRAKSKLNIGIILMEIIK